MTVSVPNVSVQLRSLVKPCGELELSLVDTPIPALGADEVLVRVEASPLNPSDLGLLFGPADISTAVYSGTAQRPVVTARIPERFMPGLAKRFGESMPVGNEGAGVVVEAGSSVAAQALLGRHVALLRGAMYAEYQTAPAAECLLLPKSVTPAEGASAFVNPLTALGMVETMRREGHSAMVNTAAASNLGQMLNRVCIKDGIALVNIVRKQEQEEILRTLGAKYVCNQAAPTFIADLTEALAETGATIAFDAIGGGKLGGQILSCMEEAINRSLKVYSRYGSSTYKQLYLYGGLNRNRTEITCSFGMSWGMGGWLLHLFLQKVGKETLDRLKQRVIAELKTTFASHYERELSLTEVLTEEMIAVYSKCATGGKFLVNPAR